MGHGECKNHKSGQLTRWTAVAAMLFLLIAAISAYAVQEDKPADNQSTEQQGQGSDLQKSQALFQELSLLLNKIQQGVQVPAPRTQSRLLPVLPASTNVYFALPNYGEALKQADDIFHEQLQERPVLNEYWQQVGMGGFIVESAIDKIHEFMQYIGSELVVSCTVTQQGPSFFVIAEIKKPGLKVFLQSLLSQFGGKNLPVRVLSPQELLTAKSTRSSKQSFVLVRPDFMVFSSDLAGLKKINTQLTAHTGTFATTPFGQRLNQAYHDGAGVLLGADLQQLLTLATKGPDNKDQAVLQKTGFADAKFFIVEYKSDGGQSFSGGELSFNGQRQGIAAWLAPPAPIGGLDFVSASAGAAGGILTKSPLQIFDELKDIVTAANPMAQTQLDQMNTELKINLRDDLISKLQGEFSFALDGPMMPKPAWKAMIKVSDPAGLQQTIAKLITAANAKAGKGKTISVEQKTDKGLTYHIVNFGKGEKHDEVAYTFADGYLVAGASRALVGEAIQIHRGGTSLLKSSDFRTSLPLNRPECSAVGYQNSAALVKTMETHPSAKDKDFAQGLQLMKMFSMGNKVVTTCVYGEPTAIRMASNSPLALGFMMGLPGAAIAIPNIMRSKAAANEAQAASIVRSVNMVQVSYSSDHPTLGFAADFKSLGTDSPVHCDADGACIHDSFRYSLSGVCEKENCKDYVIMATPVSSNGGGRSFCSTSDAIVRSRRGPVTTEQIGVEECQSWEPM